MTRLLTRQTHQDLAPQSAHPWSLM